MDNEPEIKIKEITVTLIEMKNGVPVRKIITHADGTETIEELI